jgi:hypothetical protein
VITKGTRIIHEMYNQTDRKEIRKITKRNKRYEDRKESNRYTRIEKLSQKRPRPRPE